MFIPEPVIIEYEGDPWYTIWSLGDQHKGTKHHDGKRWQEDIARVRDDPFARWIGMGDACECITYDDPKRFRPEEIAKEFLPNLHRLARAQRDSYIGDIECIADKCIGHHEGNHEAENRKRHQTEVVLDLCERLNIPYLDYMALSRVVFRRKADNGKIIKSHVMKIFSEHGSCSARTVAGVTTYLEKLMNSFEADVYFTAHGHKLVPVKKPILTITNTGKSHLVQRERYAAMTGAYYLTYQENTSSYGEKRDYPPTVLGAVGVKVRPMTGEMRLVD